MASSTTTSWSRSCWKACFICSTNSSWLALDVRSSTLYLYLCQNTHTKTRYDKVYGGNQQLQQESAPPATTTTPTAVTVSVETKNAVYDASGEPQSWDEVYTAEGSQIQNECDMYIQASAYVADENTILPSAPVTLADSSSKIGDGPSKIDEGRADEVYYNADGGIAALPKQEMVWPSAVDDGFSSSKVGEDGAAAYQNNTPWLPQVYADPNGGW